MIMYCITLYYYTVYIIYNICLIINNLKNNSQKFESQRMKIEEKNNAK